MSYRTVYKYPLAAPVVEVDIPLSGIVRLVGADPASGWPTLWVEHEAGSQTEKRTFLVVGTGAAVEPNAVHLGSMIAKPYVWHVYERRTPTQAPTS